MMTISRTWSHCMMSKKKKYYPNNWQAIKDTPDDFFLPPDGQHITYDEFMDWKIGGYQLKKEIAAIIRERNVDTGKIKEHVYRYRHAAQKKCRKLMYEGNKEITIVQQDAVHFIDPRDDIFN